jgi:hypothetical protein
VEQEVRDVQLAAAGHWSVAPGVDTGTLDSQLPAGVLVLHAAGDSGPSLALLEGRHVPEDLQNPQPPKSDACTQLEQVGLAAAQ